MKRSSIRTHGIWRTSCVNEAPRKLPSSGKVTHRLSGLIFCADCGARMVYASPESAHSEKVYDSYSNFQCSSYRRIYAECTTHFIKASALEEIILKAVQTVSEYALKNEDEFLQELMTKWKARQNQISDTEKKELAAAKRRFHELDDLIQSLYESKVKGSIPERQAERLIAQYDEEQIRLEERIAELKGSETPAGPKKADVARFMELLHRYQNITELTDTMLYEFIEKVEVHEPTGGRTKYRRQQVDVYFNFIGHYLPEETVQTEEEFRAEVDARERERKRCTARRSDEKRKQRYADLKERAKTDPEAAAEYAREDVAEVHVDAEGTAAACARAVVGVYARVAELVVARALFAVGKHLVRLVDLLELLLAVLVAGVKVGVVFFGALTVRLFDLVLARALLNAENLVVISLICHYFSSG